MRISASLEIVQLQEGLGLSGILPTRGANWSAAGDRLAVPRVHKAIIATPLGKLPTGHDAANPIKLPSPFDEASTSSTSDMPRKFVKALSASRLPVPAPFLKAHSSSRIPHISSADIAAVSATAEPVQRARAPMAKANSLSRLPSVDASYAALAASASHPETPKSQAGEGADEPVDRTVARGAMLIPKGSSSLPSSQKTQATAADAPPPMESLCAPTSGETTGAPSSTAAACAAVPPRPFLRSASSPLSRGEGSSSGSRPGSAKSLHQAKLSQAKQEATFAFNQALCEHSSTAALIMTNLPLPKITDGTADYMEHLEMLTMGCKRVLLIAGQRDAEVITMYS